MSDAVVTLLAGLGGAVIGASAAIGGQLLANMHATNADRRREAVGLVAQFWGVADRLWATVESLAYTIFDHMASREAGHTDRLPELDDRRLREIGERDAAETQARFLIAQMRLMYPRVASSAEALRAASSTFDINKRDELNVARQTALDAYEIAARRLLDDISPNKTRFPRDRA